MVGLLLHEGPAALFGFRIQDRESGGRFGEILPVKNPPGFGFCFRRRHAQPGRSGMIKKIQQARDESGQICWSDQDVKVIRNFNAAEQQECRVTLSILGSKERGHPGQLPTLTGEDNCQFCVWPLAPAAPLPPGAQVFMAQEGHMGNTLSQKGIPFSCQALKIFESAVKGKFHGEILPV